MSERICFYELHARKTLGMPPEWRISRWEVQGEGPTESLVVSGGVYPPKTRGPKKGEPNWRKPVAGTVRTVWFTSESHKHFLREWELETRKCWVCQGTADEWMGWDHIKGHHYRPCTRCGATGRAREDS